MAWSQRAGGVPPPRRSMTPACVAVVWALSVAGALAQEYRGTMLGRVADEQGAVIPGAPIVVINEATNVGAETVTEADGAFVVPFLIPGTYRVETTMPGFRKFVQSGITVAIAQRVTVDIRLTVGEMTETVEVAADATLLDTTSGGLGQVIDGKRVEAMPLNGRMIFMLNRLAGGVTWQAPTFGASGTSGLRPFDNNGGSAWSINGGRVQTNEFLLDGAPNSTRGRYNFAPPVDAVEEFKIQTNTYDAQYGRTGGGVVNMTLKSGTNQFRGQGWEFFKHEALNANDALNRSRGAAKPAYSSHQYGATGGGPLIKDRTFVMVTYEGLRERPAFPITASVPTDAERRGDFSQSYTDQGSPLIIYDPLTTRPNPANPSQFIRDAFPGNVIPADRLDPVAQRILALYPLPNVPGQRLNNFVNGENFGRYDYNAQIVRLDHKFSSSNRLSVSLHRNTRDEFRSGNGLQGSFANRGEWPQNRRNEGGTIDWVRTLRQGLLNVRAGVTAFTETVDHADVKAFDVGALGFVQAPGRFLPDIDVEQYSSLGVENEGRSNEDGTASLQANYTMSRRRQTLRFGGEYRNIRATPVTTGGANGFFNFTRAFTRRDPNAADAASGHAVASFLLGYPSEGNVGGGNARSQQWHYAVFFLQDDVRVTPKLTLNLGLRWDYESGVTEKYNRIVRGFDAEAPSPLAPAIQGRPGLAECPGCGDLSGGLRFAGVDGVPEALFDADRDNIQPRAGFAYAWNARTVLRGGYGLYYRYRDQLGTQGPFFVTTPYIASDINGRVGIPETGLNRFANPFPNGQLAAPGASEGLATLVGRGLSYDDPTNKVPYIHQYSVTVSRELARNLMVEGSYVGSQTRNLSVSGDINAISAEDQARGAAFLQQAVPNPFAGLLPGTNRNGATIQRQQLLRAFPQFDGITRNAWSIGRTSYHSFQTTVQKRMSQGVAFTGAYTFSKTTERNGFLNAQDAVAAFRDPDDLRLVEQVTDYHRPHILVFSGLYELPFGSGRRFGSGATGFTEQVIGGWQVNWSFNWQSGRPVDQPGGLEPIPGLSAKLDHPTPDRWFNTCYADLAGVPQRCAAGEAPVWVQRPPFTPRTTPNRFEDIRRPWKPTLDASLFKTARLSGRMRAEVRIEAFNLTNTVIFDTPNTDFASQNFGRIVSPRGSIYFPRNVQLGFKVYF